MAINLQEQIKFCDEKAKNIKLRTEPQTFIDIKSSLEKLQKIEEAFDQWKKDTRGIYCADDETSTFIRSMKKIVKEVE